MLDWPEHTQTSPRATSSSLASPARSPVSGSLLSCVDTVQILCRYWVDTEILCRYWVDNG